MSTHRSLYVSSLTEPLRVMDITTPTPAPGSALVDVLSAHFVSPQAAIYSGRLGFAPFTPPIIPGTGAIGRIRALGADSTTLRPGQLVYVDDFIRSRDNPDDTVITGFSEGSTEGSKKLLREVWTHAGAMSQIANVPLENCFALNEDRVFGELGLQAYDLCFLAAAVIPFGGLSSIDFKAGDCIIVAPATGGVSSMAALVALSLGASKVIAIGRNDSSLENLRKFLLQNDPRFESRLALVKNTGDVVADTLAIKSAAGPGRSIDAYFDISPATAADSTHIVSAIQALRKGGRISFMGGIRGSVQLPYGYIMLNDLTLRGKYMYERKDIMRLIQLIESGVIKLGEKAGFTVTGKFKLEEWKEAFDHSHVNHGVGKLTVFTPN